ncbi:hypothetical protein ACFO6R_10110 [Eubacterium multiforme]|uniref:KID repeat-containing protein n=1 Tax=Eubacterium multiforme TaxID=83339 RepID=A0ABT9USR1_9FIRM|nr:hypothetical protein [Eubacterium multiforme]MDQ0149362.1 hypothetical protein [Eubacterium multiforme]
MIKTTKAFLKEINKLGGRKFVSKVLIRDKEYNDDNIIDMSLEESVNPGDNFSLGSVVSNTFEINLINVDDIFENAIVKPYIGLEIDNEIEYIPLGVFTVDEVSKKDKKIKLQCVDNMFNLERAYFSDLSYPANINEVLKEICKKADITCNSILPNHSIDEIKGYSFRQAIGIIATLAGCFARFNRLGELEIISYEDTDLRITPDTFFKFETNDKDYIIGKITAKKGEKTFSKGSNTEIIIDNPVITENIVGDLYNKFKDFTYRPYTLSWQGNPAVQAGDRVVIVGVDNKEYNTLIMSHKLTYSGGITSELKATGKTESSDKFDSKGSITQAMENYSIEQAAIKVALIQKADIDEFNALNGRVNTLYTEDLTSLKANIKDLQSNKISTIEFNALESKLQTALIGKADVNELNVAVERVGIVEGKTAAIENMFNKNITSKNIATGAITANSGIIAEGAIGDAEISSLSGNKLRFGTIDTSLVSILGPQGRLRLVGNKLQVMDMNNGKMYERIMLGIDENNQSSLILRGPDGKTVLINQDGMTKQGFTNGYGKLEENELDASKLNMNSVIRGINENGSETIKGTKVQVGDRTLDVELSTQQNSIVENGKRLENQQTNILALDNAIKLKVDNQVFKETKDSINANISDTLNKANAYTNVQINTVNTNLSKHTAELNILQEEIKGKVSQSDVDKSINNIEIGDRNLLLNSNFINKYKDTSVTDKHGNLYAENWGGYNSGIANPQQSYHAHLNIEKFNFPVYEFNESDGNRNWKGISQRIKDRVTESGTFVVTMDIYTTFLKGNIFGGFYYYKKGSDKMSFGSGFYRLEPTKINEWQTLSQVYKLNDDVDFSKDIVFYVYGYDFGVNAIVYLHNIKLVKGNKTSLLWTAAPEDLNQAIIDSAKKIDEKINTVSTELTQAKDSFSASVNSLNSKTSTIETNIRTVETNIDVKIDKSKQDAINQSLKNTNSSLVEAKTYADNVSKENATIVEKELKKAKTDLKKYSDEVAIAKANLAQENAIANADNKITIEEQARIKQAQDNLNNALAKVEEAKIYANKITVTAKEDAIKQANSNTTNAINNIKFNDRNLILDSLINETSAIYGFGSRQISVSLKANTTYTFVVNGRSNRNGNIEGKHLRCYVYDVNWNYFGCNFSIEETKDITKSITFTTGSIPENLVWKVGFYWFPSGGDRTGNATVNWCKLVEGNKTSPSWTPAPEDIENQIGTAKKSIEENTAKLNQAQIDLKKYSDDVSTARVNLAVTQVKAYADGVVSKEEQSRIKQATENLNIAVTKVNQAKSDAQSYAENIATSKSNLAKAYADEVSIAKSNLAQTQAQAYADGIVTKEEQSRIKQATENLNVAIAKATDAEAKAKAYADSVTDTAKAETNKYINGKVKDVNNVVTANTSAINILKTEVSSKVNKTDIDTLTRTLNGKIIETTSKINTVETSLTQKTNNINASVSDVKSILNTKADGSTVSSIQSQLASLNIGVDGIRTEVAKKTDKNNIISAINQSAEEIKIDASKIKLNGLTTFARNTGIKAMEIDGPIINFYDWEDTSRKDSIGSIYSSRIGGDRNKTGITIANEKNTTVAIAYYSDKDKNYFPYIRFDKDNINNQMCPITLYEDINLNGYTMYLGDTKRNYMYQSSGGDFCIKTAHGLKIMDKDNGNYTANLDANYTGFAKWDQNHYYAQFFPGGFQFSGNDGKALFWLDDGSWDICTKVGMNMCVQGNLSVNGKKNRIVETGIGNLALNAVESTECWFTDMSIEQNRTDSNGDCIIWFDNTFLLTVNTKCRYKIDVTPLGEFASNGKLTYVRVVEKTERYFKVRGTPNTLFDWTITAKQIGYENIRLEKVKKG